MNSPRLPLPFNWRKNAFTRKSSKCILFLPRVYLNSRSSEVRYQYNPPVLINSFPKSGTHLLLQMAQAIPFKRDWGKFVASLGSSFFYHKTSPDELCRKIRSLVPGEICGGHLFCEKEIQQAIQRIHAVHYFIYRDLRDVVVSEAHYLTYMNRWHRLSKYFRALPTMEERILFCIRGAGDPDFPYEYPDVAQRFASYRDWLHDSKTFSLRYEDVTGNDNQVTVRKIIRFYNQQSRHPLDVDEFVSRAMKNMLPAHSHTFRKGQVGNWRTEFTDSLKDTFKQIAGNLLIELGYETDFNW